MLRSVIEVPRGLAWWRERPGGAAWLDRLPRLAAECAEAWELRLEAPFEPASISLVVPAGDAVLKLNFPERESEFEADALAAWGGEGAVRLLAADAERSALLHQDLHGGNLLLDAGRGWLAIDPKPLVGEREFDTASLLRDRPDELARDPRPAARMRRRLDQLSGELGLDRERMRRWGIVHAVAWSGASGGEWDRLMLAYARWLAQA